jgi:hypothetical protein
MSDFRIEIDQIELYLAEGRPFEGIVEQARAAIQSGGVFKIVDAVAPGHDVEIATEEKLTNFIRQYDPIQALPKDDNRFFLFLGRQLLCEVTNIRIEEGKPNVETIRTLSGAFLVPGKPSPTRIYFSCSNFINPQWNRSYFIVNHQRRGVKFLIESLNFTNDETQVVGLEVAQ